MRRRLACALVLAGWLLLPTGAGAERGRPIVLFGDDIYAPLSYLDNGQARGIDVDIANAIGAYLGRDVQIHLMNWREAQRRVLAGEADGLLSASITDERRSVYDFSEPTVTHEFALFTRQDTAAVLGARDLVGARVGVAASGLLRRYFERRPDVQLVDIADYRDGFRQLAAGTLDAMPADRWVATYAIEHDQLKQISMVGEPFLVVPSAIAVPKGHEALVNDLSRAIRALNADGTVAGVLRRWQPAEMLYMSREKMARRERNVYLTAGAVLFVAMGVWIVTLRHQVRVRRLAEERFAKAFGASPDCIAISDWQGVLEVNHRFEEMTGYRREELIGRNITDLGIVTPEVRNHFLSALRHDGAIRDFEYPARRRDGSVATIMMSAERLQIGGRDCFISVNRDITAHKAAEAALHRSEAKFRELVENASDVIFTVDRDGYCLSLNPRGLEVTGRVSSDPRGVHLREIVVPEHRERALGYLTRALRGETVAPFELDVVAAAGDRLTFELNVRPVIDNGQCVAIQGIARDVTARRQLEAQLRQAQKMDAIGRLAAGIAHDFNNLLTVILGSCEAARRELGPGDAIGGRFADIRAAGERAASLTGQLLAFSRRQITKPVVLDLNGVIGDVQRMLSRLIGEDIESCFRPGADLGYITADIGQVQQVLMNLAVNARDAMPRGGRFTIETSNMSLERDYSLRDVRVPAGDYIVLTVSDTGVGMDDETQARLFEPFFTTKDVGKGTGLGLATVYAIVKQSGGFIWVSSQEGTGSTFKIYFPRLYDAVPEPVRPQEAPASLTGSERVLIAEDEDDLRELLGDYLSAQGYEVRVAPGGAEALMACLEDGFTPSILVTDVVMPGLGGRALAERLREKDPGLKVIFLSGYTDEAMLRHGRLPVGTQFLQKPFALQALAQEVRRVLDEVVADYAADAV